MAKLIFRLRGVPDDEAEDIRLLLEKNHFDFYETDAGNWGISMPAFWLNDEAEYDRAKTLIDSYQEKRANDARQQWDENKQKGQQPTLLRSLTERPAASLGLLLFCCVILYFSIKPFFNMLSAD